MRNNESLDGPSDVELQSTVMRSTLSAQAAQIIRDGILTGRFKSGETLSQDRLSKLLGVSAMPIREALLRLAHEGFVEARHNRSFRVAPTTRADVRDAYWMYAVISSELVRRGTHNDAEALADALDLANKEMESLRPGSTAAMYEAASLRFHGAINDAAKSPKLVVVLATTRQYIPEHIYAALPDWVALSLEGHKKIARAVRKGDPDRAAATIEKHVTAAGDYLIAHFSDAGYWSEP